jgi:pyruvate dehydrogenase E2 component (dihydrolipoamide acetyltransferase)
MPVEFKLPELGENVEKGDVVRVLVSAGDSVKKDQPVLELETDKATIEVPSPFDGTVSAVRVKAGDQVTVGQTVLLIENGAGAPPAGDEAAGKAAAPAQDEAAAKAAPPADEEAAGKAAPPPDEDAGAKPAPEPAAKSADVVEFAKARQPAAREPAGETAAAADAAPAATARVAPAAAPAAEAGAGTVPAAPSVRRFARELGVDIAAVSGSGPGGRIGQDDVKAFVKGRMRAGGALPGALAAAPLPDFSKWGEVESRPMSNIRRKTAEHLSAAWQAPHVTQHDQADITELEAFRATHAKRVEAAGGKLTVTAVLIRVAAEAIRRFPQFASSADMAQQSIVYKKYVHIGVAVDTPNGLLVPVIRDADRKTITEIAVELGALSQKARDRKLTLEEMAGGVFTVTNLGGIGGTSFTPVINAPEVAILGVSRGAVAPVWRDGAFVPREMLPLSLSYDHRVIDGADAARFLRFVAEALTQPMTMYL